MAFHIFLSLFLLLSFTHLPSLPFPPFLPAFLIFCLQSDSITHVLKNTHRVFERKMPQRQMGSGSLDLKAEFGEIGQVWTLYPSLQLCRPQCGLKEAIPVYQLTLSTDSTLLSAGHIRKRSTGLPLDIPCVRGQGTGCEQTPRQQGTGRTVRTQIRCEVSMVLQEEKTAPWAFG